MNAGKQRFELVYDHIGVPTNEKSDDEVYSPDIHAHFWRVGNDPLRIEKIRFDANAPFPDEVTSRAHVAFKVDSVEKAIEGKRIVVPVTELKPGIQFAFVDVEGVLIEFFELG